MSNTTRAVRLSKLGEQDGFCQDLVGYTGGGGDEKRRGGRELINFETEKFTKRKNFLNMMGEDLYYGMGRRRVGTAVIINNLDLEQPPTKNDVENMGAVLKDIGNYYFSNIYSGHLQYVFSRI